MDRTITAGLFRDKYLCVLHTQDKLKEKIVMEQNVSFSPDGISYPLPSQDEYGKEFGRIDGLVREARGSGKEIVVVMGVGFVGAVMAAIVADTVDKETGKPSKFVIGMQRPSVAVSGRFPHSIRDGRRSRQRTRRWSR